MTNHEKFCLGGAVVCGLLGLVGGLVGGVIGFAVGWGLGEFCDNSP